jgi:hypothetical protein
VISSFGIRRMKLVSEESRLFVETATNFKFFLKIPGDMTAVITDFR